VPIQSVQDVQTVTPDGQSLKPLIHGLSIQHRPPNVDDRGELIEMYSHAWNYHPEPLVYAYSVVLNPGSVRAWVRHMESDDRIFVLSGVQQWAFYDDRADSPTHGMLNVMTFSERHRVLFTIPRGVYHGVKNIHTGESIMINMPTKPYNHANPDKHRLPVKNDLIPFDFS
jgi:dTDP-4-dehydrorhamnose 3,5-epimerase